MDKKDLPKGWGDSSDEDYIFSSSGDDNENEESPWGALNNSDENNKSSSVIINKQQNSGSENKSDKQKQSESDFIQYQKDNKKSNAVPVLIGIIFVLVLAVTVLSVLFFMRKNESNRNPGEDKIKVTEQITATEKDSEEAESIVTTMLSSEIEITAVTTAQTAKETTVPIIKTEQIKTQKTEPAVLSYKESYKKIINEEIKRLRENAGSNFSINYTLFDMDSDGTPELLINSGTCEADSLISIYTYKNNKYSQIGNNIGGSHTGFAFDYIANQIVLCNAYMGNITLSWYDIDGNGNLRFLIDTSSSGNDYNSYAVFMTSYNVLKYPFVSYSNSSDITWVFYNVDNYESYADFEYSGVNFSFIDNNDLLNSKVADIARIAAETPVSEAYTPPSETYAFSGVVNTESSDLNVRERPSKDSAILGTLPKGTSVSVYYIDGYSEWYKVYCSQYNLSGYVSAQYIVSDDFYNQTNNYYTGQVVTENDPLNLRDAPSTSSNIIIKIPKGAYVNIWGADGDWYYLSYTENGTTYYGYASRQYIK